MIQFRKYNEDQIELYKNSSFCIAAYKNLSIEQLLELQNTDAQLQLELSFVCQVKRMASLNKRAIRKDVQERKELLQRRDVFLEKLYNLEVKKYKKGVLPQNLPTIIVPNNVTQLNEENSEEAPKKNYIFLFKEDLQDPNMWTHKELSMRKEFLKELETFKNTPGGCTQCKRNTLVRKYVNKITTQQGNA